MRLDLIFSSYEASWFSSRLAATQRSHSCQIARKSEVAIIAGGSSDEDFLPTDGASTV